MSDFNPHYAMPQYPRLKEEMNYWYQKQKPRFQKSLIMKFLCLDNNNLKGASGLLDLYSSTKMLSFPETKSPT